MSYCEACAISNIGDAAKATVGAIGSVKRRRRHWVWHVHSLPGTRFNNGDGYILDGKAKTKDGALHAMNTILDIAAVAWDAGERDGLRFAADVWR